MRTKISTILEEFKAKPPLDSAPEVLTLTERNGFVRQADRFNKRLATEDVSDYKYIRRDDFAFNPYLLWAGAIARNRNFDNGVISPLYPTFRVRPEFWPGYVERLVLSEALVSAYDTIAFGSVPRRRRSSVKDFLNLEVPTPPSYAEQRRIAAILDKADDLRAKRRQAIAHLDALTQSIFHSMFGDPVRNPYGLERVSLTEAGRLYSGGTPSKEVAENWNGSTPWFSPKDLKRARLRDSIDHISPNVPAHTSLRLLQAGTVVFVVRGMILAHSFPVALLECEGTINQDLKAIIPTRDVVPEFLLACLQAQQKYVVGLVETAAHGTKKVTTETLGKTWVFDVPIELQQVFATRVAAVERLKESHRKHLVELDALFTSLQSRAFKGEL
ncbi:restriction endonuclease subunit S [Paenarthrobacter nitroguajacolicus]|uniref:restriction endonuclease subunit S n=1 Tax=Paenarthrobacter nitroguajacolicus TaxID=211146 RepID=UPI003AE5BC7C